ncbi:MAG: FGGY family carbohydrate kinase, partial [Infirmifilum sp.]
EQDVREIYHSVVKALKLAFKELKADLYLIGLSSTSPSLLLLNREFEPTGNAILWMDRRAVEEAQLISRKLGSSHIYRKTGLHVDPIFTAAKLLWVKNKHPKIFSESRYIVQVKDYLFYKLTGEALTDKSHISETLFYTLDGRFYDELLDLIGLDESMFFKPQDSTFVAPLAPNPTGELQAPNAYVALGGVDSACATLGAGGFEGGVIVDTTGTSTCLDLSTDNPVLDSKERFETYWHVVPGKYLLEACTPTGGESIRLALELVGDKGGDPDSYVKSLAPSGLMALPFLAGSRSPDWNPSIKGLIYGISLSTSREDIVKAFMEGVAFWERHVIEEFEKLGLKVHEVRLVGGGATFNWASIKANVTGRKFSIPREKEASAFGAALLAGMGYGIIRDLDELRRMVSQESLIEPTSEFHRKYDEFYKSFIDLWFYINKLAQDKS